MAETFDIIADHFISFLSARGITLSSRHQTELRDFVDRVMLADLGSGENPYVKATKMRQISTGRIGLLTGQARVRQEDGTLRSEGIFTYDDEQNKATRVALNDVERV
jgi:hypothetical protein